MPHTLFIYALNSSFPFWITCTLTSHMLYMCVLWSYMHYLSSKRLNKRMLRAHLNVGIRGSESTLNFKENGNKSNLKARSLCLVSRENRQASGVYGKVCQTAVSHSEPKHDFNHVVGVRGKTTQEKKQCRGFNLWHTSINLSAHVLTRKRKMPNNEEHSQPSEKTKSLIRKWFFF